MLSTLCTVFRDSSRKRVLQIRKSRFLVYICEGTLNCLMSNRNVVKTSEEESDDYLIELIGLKEDFPDEAKAAYGKIYERYGEVMYAIAKKICINSKDHEAEAQDLVADTFYIIYHKKAKSFDKTKISEKYLRYSIISWMKKVMLSVHYDLYLDEPTKEQITKEKKENREHRDDGMQESYIIPQVALRNHLENSHQEFIDALDRIEIGAVDVNNEEQKETKNDELVYNYINSLPKREADIVREVYTFYVPGKNTTTELLDYIENKWGTTRENYRRIMKKFRDKIKEDLKEKIVIRR